MTEQNLSDLLQRVADRTHVGPPPIDDMLVRTHHRRRRRTLLVTTASSIAVATIVAGAFLALDRMGQNSVNAAASCAAPVLAVTPGDTVPKEPGHPASLGPVPRGTVVQVYGSEYLLPCDDTVKVGQPLPSRPGPLASVPLTLATADGRTRPLVTAHPNKDGSFTAQAKIPPDAAVGPAVITAPAGQRIILVVKDSATSAGPSEGSPTNTALNGTWTVRALVGANGKSVLPASYAHKVEMTFKAGKMTGTTGCNDVFGTYEQRGQDLVFPRSQLGSTLVGCADEPPLVTRLLAVRHISGSSGVRYLHAANWMIVVELRHR